MDDNNHAVYIFSQAICAQIEMNAMIAENLRWTIQNQSPVYTEKDFIALIEKYGIGHNSVVGELWHR